MKKMIVISGAIIYMLFAVSLFTSAKTQKNSVDMQFLSTYETVAQREENDFLYILTVEEGVVVVKNRNNRIVRETDTRVSVLPEQDRESLEKGIKVKSEKELSGLLEDFCS